MLNAYAGGREAAYFVSVGGLQTVRLVGSGLALPSFHVSTVLQGQGKHSPYETLKLFAKKTRTYRIAARRGKAAEKQVKRQSAKGKS